MNKKIWLKEIESEYLLEINKFFENGNEFNADNFISMSIRLFNEIKVKRLSKDEEEEADMLLFQYGIHDSGENGKVLYFDITRQFMKPNYSLCQLSFTIHFNLENNQEIESYNSWNTDFSNIEEWEKFLKTTGGYQKVKSKLTTSYKLDFGQL